MESLLDDLLETIRTGRRKQDALFPNEYRYYKRFDKDDVGNYIPNNFIVTGWTKHIVPKN